MVCIPVIRSNGKTHTGQRPYLYIGIGSEEQLESDRESELHGQDREDVDMGEEYDNEEDDFDDDFEVEEVDIDDEVDYTQEHDEEEEIDEEDIDEEDAGAHVSSSIRK